MAARLLLLSLLALASARRARPCWWRTPRPPPSATVGWTPAHDPALTPASAPRRTPRRSRRPSPGGALASETKTAPGSATGSTDVGRTAARSTDVGRAAGPRCVAPMRRIRPAWRPPGSTASAPLIATSQPRTRAVREASGVPTPTGRSMSAARAAPTTATAPTEGSVSGLEAAGSASGSTRASATPARNTRTASATAATSSGAGSWTRRRRRGSVWA